MLGDRFHTQYCGSGIVCFANSAVHIFGRTTYTGREMQFSLKCFAIDNFWTVYDHTEKESPVTMSLCPQEASELTKTCPVSPKETTRTSEGLHWNNKIIAYLSQKTYKVYNVEALRLASRGRPFTSTAMWSRSQPLQRLVPMPEECTSHSLQVVQHTRWRASRTWSGTRSPLMRTQTTKNICHLTHSIVHNIEM